MMSAFLISGIAVADEVVTETETDASVLVKLDEITGLPVDGQSATNQPIEDQDVITVAAGVTYDRNTGLYSISVNGVGNDVIQSSISTGALTQQSVTVTISNNVTCKIFKSGIEQEASEDNIYKEPGNYVFKLYGSSGSTYIPLTFTILPNNSNTDSLVTSGIYTIDHVLLGENSLDVSNNTISTTEEGKYSVYVLNKVLGTTELIEINILHNMPSLKLEALDEKNFARGPVDISDAQKDWIIEIYFNGEKINTPDEQVTDPGRYSIIVTDVAGNSTTYTFTILLYIDNMALIFICIVVGLTLLLFIVIIFSRKKMKVR